MPADGRERLEALERQLRERRRDATDATTEAEPVVVDAAAAAAARARLTPADRQRLEEVERKLQQRRDDDPVDDDAVAAAADRVALLKAAVPDLAEELLAVAHTTGRIFDQATAQRDLDAANAALVQLLAAEADATAQLAEAEAHLAAVKTPHRGGRKPSPQAAEAAVAAAKAKLAEAKEAAAPARYATQLAEATVATIVEWAAAQAAQVAAQAAYERAAAAAAASASKRNQRALHDATQAVHAGILRLTAAVVGVALPPRPSKGHAAAMPLAYLPYIAACGRIVDAFVLYRVRSHLPVRCVRS